MSDSTDARALKLVSESGPSDLTAEAGSTSQSDAMRIGGKVQSLGDTPVAPTPSLKKTSEPLPPSHWGIND